MKVDLETGLCISKEEICDSQRAIGWTSSKGDDKGGESTVMGCRETVADLAFSVWVRGNGMANHTNGARLITTFMSQSHVKII